jgi:hypothetical protein
MHNLQSQTMSMQDVYELEGRTRAVYFDGPWAEQNHEGEEIPTWLVYIGDEEAEPVSHLITFHSYQIAYDYAQHLAGERRLELIHEASPA